MHSTKNVLTELSVEFQRIEAKKKDIENYIGWNSASSPIDIVNENDWLAFADKSSSAGLFLISNFGEGEILAPVFGILGRSLGRTASSIRSSLRTTTGGAAMPLLGAEAEKSNNSNNPS
jgi:hypothetical protein